MPKKVVTQAIRRVTPDGIETMDGRHHAVDTIVYGTGFAATEFRAPMFELLVESATLH